jgi:hypothetical protein
MRNNRLELEESVKLWRLIAPSILDMNGIVEDLRGLRHNSRKVLSCPGRREL